MTTTPDQLPPHDDQAEAGALACVMISPNGEGAALLDQLEGSDFYDIRHRRIFETLVQLQFDNRPPSAPEVYQRLKDNGQVEDAGGQDYVLRLPDQIPSAANFPTYLDTVRDRTTRRAALRNGTKLAEQALDLRVPIETLADTAKRIAEAHAVGSGSTDRQPPEARPLAELDVHPDSDPGELLRHRYLCRSGGMLIAGPTGIGKSSFVMQAVILWALGREMFGIAPAKPLKSLIIQAENDDGDLAEMRDGVIEGLGLTDEEREAALALIVVCREDARIGADFFNAVVRPLLAKHKPDLLIIDPALAYLGGETSSQADVGKFLRNGLNPLLREFNCAAGVVHHTNKPATGREKSTWAAGDFAYLGSGSAEWANWARAVLAIRSVGSHHVYELNAAKRGARLQWEDANGERAYTKLIAHSKTPGTICWVEAAEDDKPDKGGRKAQYTKEMVSVLLRDKPLTTTEWRVLAKAEEGISGRQFHRMKSAAISAGQVKRQKDGTWGCLL